MDREKVIKGLEWCLFKTGCNGCPYRNDCDDGEQMERDALALLKAQEPLDVCAVNYDRSITLFSCRACNTQLLFCQRFCHMCGRAVKWDG